jgi:hypothetical protein
MRRWRAVIRAMTSLVYKLREKRCLTSWGSCKLEEHTSRAWISAQDSRSEYKSINRGLIVPFDRYMKMCEYEGTSCVQVLSLERRSKFKQRSHFQRAVMGGARWLKCQGFVIHALAMFPKLSKVTTSSRVHVYTSATCLIGVAVGVEVEGCQI